MVIEAQTTEDIKPLELTVTFEQQKKIDAMIEASKIDNVTHWDQQVTKEIYVPIDGGKIRVLHIKPKNPTNKRIIVIIPGWGVTSKGFDVLYEVLHNEIEFYYIETREKGSSQIRRRKANLTIQQKAKDIMKAIDYLKIDKDNYTLVGPCWSATIFLQGLLDNNLEAKSILIFDPMHKLWFNKFLLNVSPFIPSFVVTIILKPIIIFFAFLGMKEKAQKERSKSFAKNAVMWKWKKAAYAVKDLELFGTLNPIKQEILVFNGTTDKVHKQTDYPKLSKELPKGRFFFLNTIESNRERIMSVVIKEFAKTEMNEKIPPVLREFEKELERK